MPEFASESAAAEALANANAGDVAAPEVAPVEQAPAPGSTQHVEPGTNQSSESFTTLDLNSVPEELRPLVQEKFNQFNADYTRKTQEVAPLRQLMSETGMDADTARQALEFVQGLNDPDNLRSLYDQLGQQFSGEFGDDGEQGFGDEVDPRDQQINDLSSRLERFEQAQAMQAAESQLTTAITQVKSAHPDWSDNDIERVQKLAVVHMQHPGTDINRAMAAAADEFKGWRDEVLGQYLDGKGNVVAGATPALGDTSHAQTPTTFGNLDEATKAALTRFGADWAN